MPVVNYLVDDLVNEHEILPDSLFVEDSAVVPEDLHHSIDDVHDKAGGDIVLGCGHKVDAELFSEKVIQTIDVLSTRVKSEEYLRRKEVDHRPIGSLFGRILRTFLSRGPVGLYLSITQGNQNLQSLKIIVSPLPERMKN
jgi:hypothetical protein